MKKIIIDNKFTCKYNEFACKFWKKEEENLGR